MSFCSMGSIEQKRIILKANSITDIKITTEGRLKILTPFQCRAKGFTALINKNQEKVLSTSENYHTAESQTVNSDSRRE